MAAHGNLSEWDSTMADANARFNAGASEFRPAMSTRHFDPNFYVHVGHNGLETAEGRWGPRNLSACHQSAICGSLDFATPAATSRAVDNCTCEFYK